MRPPGPASRQVLLLLDPGAGGVFSANFEYLKSRLSEKGIEVEETALYHIMERLIEKGDLERVPTGDGGAVYTRPSVLLKAPGLVSAMGNVPARKGRKGSLTSDRVYDNRSKKAISRWQQREVDRGVHDHRDPHRPCPVEGCWAWPPKNVEAYLAARERSKESS